MTVRPGGKRADAVESLDQATIDPGGRGHRLQAQLFGNDSSILTSTNE